MKRNNIILGIVMFVLAAGIALSVPESGQTEDIKEKIYAPESYAPIKERIDLETRLTKLLEEIPIMFRVQTKKSEWEINSGTGFLLEKKLLVTANHLLDPPIASELFIDGKWTKTDLIGRVHTKDIGILKVPALINKEYIPSFKSADLIFAEFPNNKNVSLDKILVGMRCMSENEPKIFIGELRSFDKKTKELEFKVRNNIAGCSGAPVVYFDGSIIGMANSSMGFIVGALDISEIIEAVDFFKPQTKK